MNDPSDQQPFLSISNYDFCLKVFQNYMKREYDLTISDSDYPDLRKNLLQTMQDVRQANPRQPIKQLNNIVLNEMRDTYLVRLNVPAQKKPAVRNLNRDQQLYGNRPVMQAPPDILPTMTTNNKSDVNSTFEKLLNERNAPQDKAPIPSIPSVRIDNAPSTTDFLKTYEQLEQERNNQRFESTMQIQKERNDTYEDPQAIFKSFTNTIDEAKKELYDDKYLATPYQNHNKDLLIRPTKERYFDNVYLLINGFDRNWASYPERYRFTIDLNETGLPLKNITQLAFTRLILPMEIAQTKRNNTFIQANDATYYNQYGLTYPYVLLNIDEFTNYGGLNKSTQKCATTFVYDTEYRAPNGRGFLIMQPLQDEVKRFYPTPMSSLSKLNITIRKPNGTLYNVSKDENKLTALQYETVNPLLMRLHTLHFYDKNEYYTGDVIMTKNLKLKEPNDFASQYNPLPQDLAIYTNYKRFVEDFLNRPEGHEVIEIGDTNQNTYHKSFYCYLPRALDKEQGTLVVQSEVMDFIQVCQKYAQQIEFASKGDMINMSLQLVLSLKAETTSIDTKQLTDSINI
jgi:hypothetical protein